jgi:hypothetical protein
MPRDDFEGVLRNNNSRIPKCGIRCSSVTQTTQQITCSPRTKAGVSILARAPRFRFPSAAPATPRFATAFPVSNFLRRVSRFYARPRDETRCKRGSEEIETFRERRQTRRRRRRRRARFSDIPDVMDANGCTLLCEKTWENTSEIRVVVLAPRNALCPFLKTAAAWRELRAPLSLRARVLRFNDEEMQALRLISTRKEQ